MSYKPLTVYEYARRDLSGANSEIKTFELRRAKALKALASAEEGLVRARAEQARYAVARTALDADPSSLLLFIVRVPSGPNGDLRIYAKTEAAAVREAAGPGVADGTAVCVLTSHTSWRVHRWSAAASAFVIEE